MNMVEKKADRILKYKDEIKHYPGSIDKNKYIVVVWLNLNC